MAQGVHTHEIALLPGDGTGIEVTQASLTVLEAAQERFDIHLEVEEHACGAQHYKEHGQEWAPGAFEATKEADAILLGAIGWPGVSLPDGNIAGAGVVFGLRFGLDLYANVRPTKLYPGVPHKIHGAFQQVWQDDLVDMVILRENTEGLYTPARGELNRGGHVEVAVDNNVITAKGSERIQRRAFEIAQRRDGAPGDGTHRVTCIDKANVLAGSRLFRSTFGRVAQDYPGIETDHAYVDAFCQWLVRSPEYYDVCVTTNMLGDIVTDLAAVLQGGMGMAPSGNIGDEHAMFEPVHGSAPKHAGKDKVNPIACILAGQMMLDWLGREREDPRCLEAAEAIEAAVRAVLQEGKTLTYDLGGTSGTQEVAQAIAQRVQQA
ncbi:MAG: isocitrate/isopropylmalate dehydrogenase family protein [Candidatus Thermoplasmatota archaeon]|nr:isocitrate/isopropylmalate dehydrogenase family protein [Candidatus Thermoplasmatota archaeon]